MLQVENCEKSCVLIDLRTGAELMLLSMLYRMELSKMEILYSTMTLVEFHW